MSGGRCPGRRTCRAARTASPAVGSGGGGRLKSAGVRGQAVAARRRGRRAGQLRVCVCLCVCLLCLAHIVLRVLSCVLHLSCLCCALHGVCTPCVCVCDVCVCDVCVCARSVPHPCVGERRRADRRRPATELRPRQLGRVHAAVHVLRHRPRPRPAACSCDQPSADSRRADGIPRRPCGYGRPWSCTPALRIKNAGRGSAPGPRGPAGLD